MDLRLLREATRPQHEATEALMPVMEPGLDVALYVRVLQILLPLLSSWERWAGESAPEDIRPLLAARRRSPLLEADLASLGAQPERQGLIEVNWKAVAEGSGTRGFAAEESAVSEAEFLGCLYVMEGSTLGGRYIARHVQETLHLSPGVGNAYFQGNGDQTGPMWREITARISAVPDDQSDRLIGSARRTFTAFGDALEAGLAGGMVRG